jgi:hypothetical protein
MICRICGNDGIGSEWSSWVSDTFTNYDLLLPGEIICDDCRFWFGQKSDELQRRMRKDKPQKMQNYSHFIIGGEWRPVGKGDKSAMAQILTTPPFPEMAAVAVSGQKHLAFRARRNPPGGSAGWVQYEEQAVWVIQDDLRGLLKSIEALYAGFSKSEIESGRYFPQRILRFGVDRWQELEACIKHKRSTVIFSLALFMAQRSEDGNDEGAGGSTSQVDLAGRTAGIQEPLPDDDLGAIRERNPQRGIHERRGAVHQLSMFPSGGENREHGRRARRS